MARLQGKTALVTGAARGIGLAISRAFAAEGAVVYLTDMRAQFTGDLPPAARYLPLDVRSETDWRQVTQQILDEREALDIVVNNAGITGFEESSAPHDPEHASLEDWRRVHETNLDGVFLACKHAIAAMRWQGRGSIINLSSRSVLVGIPAAAAYASSKAAVRNHTKTVALYCAGQGLAIRCNSLHPAAILTPMWDPVLGHGPDREQHMAAFVQDCPQRRFGTPEEVAAVAVMLASDEAPHITGSEITIDGGILAGSAGTPRERSTGS